MAELNYVMETFREHLVRRGYHDKIRAWIDYESEIVRFPIWCGTKLIGYQKYNWCAGKLRSNDAFGRYITKCIKEYKVLAIWGTEYNLTEEIYLTEGIWDAIRILQAGFSARALICNNPSKALKGYLKLLYGGRPLIPVLDNDDNKAGLKLQSTGNRPPVFLPSLYKDVNEVPPRLLRNILSKIE